MTAGIAPFTPSVRVLITSLNGIPWIIMLTVIKMTTIRKASMVLAELKAIYVPIAILMIIRTGKMKFRNILGLSPGYASMSVSSLPISGVAPSRSTFPSSWALRSAFFIGPKSLMIPDARSPTNRTAKIG